MTTYARNDYTGNGVTTNFTVTFPYILQAHVGVYKNGVLQALTTDYTWFNSTTIKFVVAPGNLVPVAFIRSSNPAAKLVDFQDASTLTEASLDRAMDQVFFMAQEAIDTTAGTMVLDVDGKWQGNNHRIKNVADPFDAQEVVTKGFGDANYGGS